MKKRWTLAAGAAVALVGGVGIHILLLNAPAQTGGLPTVPTAPRAVTATEVDAPRTDGGAKSQVIFADGGPRSVDIDLLITGEAVVGGTITVTARFSIPADSPFVDIQGSADIETIPNIHIPYYYDIISADPEPVDCAGIPLVGSYCWRMTSDVGEVKTVTLVATPQEATPGYHGIVFEVLEGVEQEYAWSSAYDIRLGDAQTPGEFRKLY